MKVYKVADIVNNEVLLCVPRAYEKADVSAILMNLEGVNEPRPESSWRLEILIGQGPSARRHILDLRTVLSVNDSLDGPLFLADRQRERGAERLPRMPECERLVFYRNRLFMSERGPRTVEEREEIVLRIKKLVYDEEADLASLKAAVANIEATIEYVKSGPRRDPIPEDVKLLV